MASPAPIRVPKAGPLQRADWGRAAFARLAQDGIDAVRVEVLARDLHVSKGSFYWHFRDRDELAGAMLEQWEEDERAWLEAGVAGGRGAGGGRGGGGKEGRGGDFLAGWGGGGVCGGGGGGGWKGWGFFFCLGGGAGG